MLEQFLEPQLLDDGVLESVVLQQLGAPCHYARIVQECLNICFLNQWIGCGGNGPWVPHSLDLTFRFFASGFRKSKVYLGGIQDSLNLNKHIWETVNKITPEMLANVFCNTTDWHEILWGHWWGAHWKAMTFIILFFCFKHGFYI